MTESGIEQLFGAEYLEWQVQNEPPEIRCMAEYNEGQYITVRLLLAALDNQQIVSVEADGVDKEDLEYDLQFVG